MLKMVRVAIASGAMFAVSTVSADFGYVDDILAAAERGECIEDRAAALITKKPEQDREIVCDAYEAYQQRFKQQQELKDANGKPKCDGDIAAKAIAAGATMDDVLSCRDMQVNRSGALRLQGIGSGSAGSGGGFVSGK